MKRYGRNDQFFSLVFHDLKNFNFFKCKFSLRIYVRFQFRGAIFLRNRNDICLQLFRPVLARATKVSLETRSFLARVQTWLGGHRLVQLPSLRFTALDSASRNIARNITVRSNTLTRNPRK